MQLPRFVLVGAAGFVVDSGVLYAALAIGLGELGGRLVSFFFAALFTWLANRHFTFPHRAVPPGVYGLLAEWVRYQTAMTGGMIINIGVYLLVMKLVDDHPVLPMVAVGAGSIAGLAFNFAAAKRWVFNR
jgi:putative flippase GtrA